MWVNREWLSACFRGIRADIGALRDELKKSPMVFLVGSHDRRPVVLALSQDGREDFRFAAVVDHKIDSGAVIFVVGTRRRIVGAFLGQHVLSSGIGATPFAITDREAEVGEIISVHLEPAP